MEDDGKGVKNGGGWKWILVRHRKGPLSHKSASTILTLILT